MKTILLALTLSLSLPTLGGCIGTFGGARPVTLGAPSDPEKQKRCDSIDNLQLISGGTTLILSAAAGGTGLVAWRVSDDGTKDALIITAGAAGLLAVGTGYIWDSKQKQWVREGCGS